MEPNCDTPIGKNSALCEHAVASVWISVLLAGQHIGSLVTHRLACVLFLAHRPRCRQIIPFLRNMVHSPPGERCYLANIAQKHTQKHLLRNQMFASCFANDPRWGSKNISESNEWLWCSCRIEVCAPFCKNDTQSLQPFGVWFWKRKKFFFISKQTILDQGANLW